MHCHDLNTSTKHIVNEQDNKAQNNLALIVAIYKQTWKQTVTRHRATQALADISRSGYFVIAKKPVHRLQIRPIVHN